MARAVQSVVAVWFISLGDRGRRAPGTVRCHGSGVSNYCTVIPEFHEGGATYSLTSRDHPAHVSGSGFSAWASLECEGLVSPRPTAPTALPVPPEARRAPPWRGTGEGDSDGFQIAPIINIITSAHFPFAVAHKSIRVK